MNTEKLNDSVLLDYIFKLLPEKESQEIDELLERDELLALSVDGLIDFCLNNNLNRQEAEKVLLEKQQELNERFTGVTDQHEFQVKPTVFRLKKVLIAASIGLLITIAGTLYFIIDKSYTSEELYSQYYEPFYPDIELRGEDSNEIVYSEAIEKYYCGEYAEAIRLFNSVIQHDSQNAQAQIFLGNALMNEENLVDAIKVFEKIIHKDDNIYVTYADWYLGLCYLKNEEAENARVLFEKIVEQNSYWKQQASDILREMK